MKEAFAHRFRGSKPLEKSPAESIERFLNSTAVFLSSEIFARLQSGYDFIRFEAINQAIESAHSTTSMELGKPGLFRFPANSRYGDVYYGEAACNYLIDKRISAGERVTFLEFLLLRIAHLRQIPTEFIEERVNRFLRSNVLPLRYDQLQFAPLDDERIMKEISEPFWRIVEDSQWKSVRGDMEAAFRQRDQGGPNAALFSARALESTIKIIAEDLGRTTGSERGAGSYIDSLVSQKKGRFLATWEGDALRRFFSDVRNPEAHGAGSSPQPELTPEQTTWSIEFCMISIKSLISRRARSS